MENDLKNEFKRRHPHHRNHGMGFGVLLVIVGLLFLGFNSGFLASPLKHILISWPMIFIIFGTSKLYQRNYMSSIILYSIGVFFLLPRVFEAYPAYFPEYNGNFTHNFWPLLLILAGVVMLVSKSLNRNNTEFKKCDHGYYNKKDAYSSSTGSFSKNSIFGGGEHIVLEPDFKGGEVNAIFGGLTLDLRHTTLSEGTSRLDVNAVFGGVTIIVPRDWFVETHIDAVFGGFEDKRLIKEMVNVDRKLIITGACVFGGGELRD